MRQQSGHTNPVLVKQEIYTLHREEEHWYVHFPAYIARGGCKKDLRLAEGAPKFLNSMANGASCLRLRLGTAAWEGCSFLELVEHCAAPKGGAIYAFASTESRYDGALFWICDLALFAFGDMPDQIFVQRLPDKKQRSPKERFTHRRPS